MERSRTETVVALALMLGGAIGLVLFTVLAFNQLPGQAPSGALLAVPPIALFAWSCFVGFRLWQATTFGRRWALWLSASQILVIGLPFAAFNWFTGAMLVPKLTIDGGISMNVAIQAGAAANYFFGLQDGPIVLGVNLFAVWATWAMFRRVYAIRRIEPAEGE